MRRTRSGIYVPVGDELPGWRTDDLDCGDPERNVPLLLSLAKRTAPMVLSRIAGATNTPYMSMPNPAVVTSPAAVPGTAEAALWPVSPYTAVGANGPSPNAQSGQLWLVIASGVMTTAGASQGNVTVTPRWGTSTGGVTFGASAVNALAASATAVSWMYVQLGEIRSISASSSSSSITANGVLLCDSRALTTATPIACGGTVIANGDTTTAQGWFLGVTLGSASDTMTTQIIACVCLN